jgi:iron complex transport system permease protein
LNPRGLLPVDGPVCIEQAQRRMWVLLPVLLVLVFVLELCLGSVLIAPQWVMRILVGDVRAPESWRQIVLLFRLPRAITALLAGASLGMAGLQMQTLFRNPLADPSVLGVNSGASLGVALVVMAAGAVSFGASVTQVAGAGMVLVIASSLGSLAVMSVVLAVARRVENSLTLLIVGLMVGYLTSSVVTVLMSFALEQQLQRYIGWTFGSFAGVTWRQLKILAPVLMLTFSTSLLLSKTLNALLLGERYARSLGIRVRIARMLLTLGASILAGSVTAYCGPIGFLGIAVPHLARSLMRTTDHHVLAPVVLLIGATLALMSDLIAQAPGTALALPLNAITSLIGAPIVLSVVLRRRQVLEAGA